MPTDSDLFASIIPLEDRFRTSSGLKLEIRNNQIKGAKRFKKEFKHFARQLKRDYLTPDEIGDILIEMGVAQDRDSAKKTLDLMEGKKFEYSFYFFSNDCIECYFQLERMTNLQGKVAYRMITNTPLDR